MICRLEKHCNQTPQQARGSSGVTLIELTIVLAIIAVVMGAALTLLTKSAQDGSRQITESKLRTLKQALYDYRIAYNRLPCPADNVTYAITTANFGVEAATTTDCRGGVPAAEAGDTTAAVGMIPVRTLGLPDDAAFDGWGRRIRYAVSPAFVVDDAFDAIPATSTTARLSVTNNSGGASMATIAAFVLVSYGDNGHGGRGGNTGTLISGGITNANELINCKCDATGALDAGADMDAFVAGGQKPDPANPLNNFDDVVVFATRAELRNATE